LDQLPSFANYHKNDMTQLRFYYNMNSYDATSEVSTRTTARVSRNESCMNIRLNSERS